MKDASYKKNIALYHPTTKIEPHLAQFQSNSSYFTIINKNPTRRKQLHPAYLCNMSNMPDFSNQAKKYFKTMPLAN